MKFASAAFGLSLLVLTLGLSFHLGNTKVAGEAAVTRSSPILDALSPVVVQKATTEGNALEPIIGARAAVIPHHDLATALIGRTVGRLRAGKPNTIVIVGPDHPNEGNALFTVSGSDWRGPTGLFRTNQEMVSALKKLPMVSLSDELIAREHSVLIPLPFLAARFPESHFVLLTVRGGFPAEDIRALATILANILGPDDLVIASVDFSHYKPLAAAQAEDDLSLAALRSGDPDALASIPADSPASLAIAATFAHAHGARSMTLVDHSNSALLLGDQGLLETTSYITAVWH